MKQATLQYFVIVQNKHPYFIDITTAVLNTGGSVARRLASRNRSRFPSLLVLKFKIGRFHRLTRQSEANKSCTFCPNVSP